MKNFEYTSVHQYLDCVLQNNPNASHAEIKEAKKAYSKLYYSHYRKQKRKSRKEFTVGFYKEQLEKIHQKRGTQTVSKFLYQTIKKELQSDSKPSFDADVMAAIHLELMQLITLIEELLENTDSDKMTTALDQLAALEDSFSQILNS
jgi:hypothetical protein